MRGGKVERVVGPNGGGWRAEDLCDAAKLRGLVGGFEEAVAGGRGEEEFGKDASDGPHVDFFRRKVACRRGESVLYRV